MYLDNFIRHGTWICEAQMCVCSLNVDISFLGWVSVLGMLIALCSVSACPGDAPVMLMVQ